MKLPTNTEIPAVSEALAQFDELPDSALVRLPTVASLFGISRATTWRCVKDGRLPKPIKMGPSLTAWRVGDLRDIQFRQARA